MEWGSIPEEILYDRMKTVWLGTDGRGEIVWHPVFLDFARHWGFRPRLCRPSRAQTKGKIESGVKHVRRNFVCGLLGREPSCLMDFNTELRQCGEWRRQPACARDNPLLLTSATAVAWTHNVGAYVRHYNRGRPHSALGPDSRSRPEPRFRLFLIGTGCPPVPVLSRHLCSARLHHEYGLERRLSEWRIEFLRRTGLAVQRKGSWPKEISPNGRADGPTRSPRMATCESTRRETSLWWAASASRRPEIGIGGNKIAACRCRGPCSLGNGRDGRFWLRF